jgi:4-hydroxy-tetrahydrodipicolinate synthase
VDALAALTFRAPMDTYVQRMAWLAEWEGRLPAGLCHDPVSAPAPDHERRELIAAVKKIVGAVPSGR